jgi:hypothetical protein
MRTEGGRIEIRTEGNDPTIFLGKEQGNVIAGELRYRAAILDFGMERELPLPQPNSRAEAWRQDLDYAQRKLLRLETSFTSDSRHQFLDSIANLKASITTVDDPTSDSLAPWLLLGMLTRACTCCGIARIFAAFQFAPGGSETSCTSSGVRRSKVIYSVVK